MPRALRRFVLLWVTALFVVAPAAGAGVDFEDVAPDLGNLRAIFDSDAEKVRLILLVAPT